LKASWTERGCVTAAPPPTRTAPSGEVATSSGSPTSVWWWEIEEVEVVVEEWRTWDGRTWKRRRDCGLGSETEDREARGWIGSSEAERGRSTERKTDPFFFSSLNFLVVETR
jgi:hypothetical protein